MKINIDIIEKRATVCSAPVIVCGNTDYTLAFTFDDEWAGLDKIARLVFWREGALQYMDLALEGDTLNLPAMINTEELYVGVYAGDLRTTVPARIQCLKSVKCMTDEHAGEAPEDIYTKMLALVQAYAGTRRIGYVTLLASNWEGDASPYSQVVSVAGATKYSQVDLTPDAEQLSIFHNKDLAFVTENEGGVITVFAIGQKPTNDYTIQATITEVNV